MLFLDHSAWSRLLADQAPPHRENEVLDWIEDGRLATCLPFLLEAGFSAQDAAEHSEGMERLRRLSHFPVDETVERAALNAQADLAGVGHHRMAPADLLIAACAHVAGGGVLHYDRDYDLILEHTRLSFESVWLAEPGTI
ncbi:MAG TPA: PIN domain-containing protein [Solirubrobacterales bacterium]